MKRQTVTKLEDVDRLEAHILHSVETTIQLLKGALESGDGLIAFAKLKFTEAGRDPLNAARPLNLVEQLNQTFTYLASLAGARWLLQHHPECAPLVLNLGTAPGFDIESECGHFIAETFAVTHPGSNGKLRKDVRKLKGEERTHRFVFYLSLVARREFNVPGITVVRLEHRALAALR